MTRGYDLDLHVAVYDQYLSAFWENRSTLYERVDRPVRYLRHLPAVDRKR